MSRENLDLVHRALQAYADGDIERMLSYLDPHAELYSAIIGGAEGKTYAGRAGIGLVR